MNRSMVAVAAFALATMTFDVEAQRVTIDVRGGFAAPVQKLRGSDLHGGPVVAGVVAFRVLPNVHVYGGWDWVQVLTDESLGGTSQNLQEPGYHFGLRFESAVRASPRPSLRVEAGGTYKHIEIEDNKGDLVAESGLGLGYEASGSAVFPFGGVWRLVPGLRYRALSRDFRLGGSAFTGHLRYVAIELGISRRL
jgi:hypothetical protein